MNSSAQNKNNNSNKQNKRTHVDKIKTFQVNRIKNSGGRNKNTIPVNQVKKSRIGK